MADGRLEAREGKDSSFGHIESEGLDVQFQLESFDWSQTVWPVDLATVQWDCNAKLDELIWIHLVLLPSSRPQTFKEQRTTSKNPK